MKYYEKNMIIRFVNIVKILIFASAFSFHSACADECKNKFAPIDVVYHGSTNLNIKTFEPKSEHIRDPNEGPVVFATPSIALASCYLFKWDDSWVHQLISWKDNNKSDYEITMVISDKKKFQKDDLGGAIYFLPARGFGFSENKGLGIYEWINKGKVSPYTQMNFSSALKAMKTFKVNVYFVDKAQFDRYINLSGEEQQKYLSTLKHY